MHTMLEEFLLRCVLDAPKLWFEMLMMFKGVVEGVMIPCMIEIHA